MNVAGLAFHATLASGLRSSVLPRPRITSITRTKTKGDDWPADD